MQGVPRLRSARELTGVRGRHVIVRVDYNVELHNGKVLDTERIDRSMRLIRFLLKKRARVILLSHLGRPEGVRTKKYSLKPLVPYIAKAARVPVYFADDCIGAAAEHAASKLKNGELLLLENVRFYTEEADNNIVFAQQLASLGDVYVNEAFSSCHRAHASVHAITRLLPSYAGFNLEEEVHALSKLLGGFKKPSCAVIGGAKISTKAGLIESLARRHSKVLIGGALAHTFFAARKIPIGVSVVERGFAAMARSLLKKYGSKLVLPSDVVIVDMSRKRHSIETVPVSSLARRKGSFSIMDIGPKTANRFSDILMKARTIIWNGPLGLFEDRRFSSGTLTVARAIAQRSIRGVYTVVGGGETVAALKETGTQSRIDFVSTAGGAMLEYLEKGTLPGIQPLLKIKH